MFCWFRSAAGFVSSKVAARPYAAAGIITGTKTCLADLGVQKYWEKKEEINWRRNLVFTAFGAGYLGFFQCFLYSRCFPKWFPGRGLKTAAACVVFDQTINTGVWYYPLFYVIQDAIMLGKFDGDTVYDGLARYKQNIFADMMNCWKLWIPAQFVNFALVPLHFRAPYAASISVVWTCVISALRGDMLAATAEKQIKRKKTIVELTIGTTPAGVGLPNLVVCDDATPSKHAPDQEHQPHSFHQVMKKDTCSATSC